MRKGFVRVRNVDHYAVEVDGRVWRTEFSADQIYERTYKSARLLKAGEKVAATFTEWGCPFTTERHALEASGMRVRMTKYRLTPPRNEETS